MKLYLVRHATATDRFGGTVQRDEDRYLTDGGRQEAEQVAQAMKKFGAKPDTFITSPLVRARQTAEIFAEVAGHKGGLDFSDAMAPGGTFSDLYKQIAGHKKASEICLFGHQPDMTRLAQALLWSSELDMPFKKAGVCRIDVFDLPPTRPGTLKWFITPKIAHHFVKH